MNQFVIDVKALLITLPNFDAKTLSLSRTCSTVLNRLID